MKARYVLFVLVLLAGACLFGYWSWSRNPLRRSDTQIRAWLLQKTPIGSTREQVMATIEREHWNGHPEYRGEIRPEIENVRYFSYGAQLGTYDAFFAPVIIFPCDVEAYWVFGADDRVTHVFVSSYCHGL